MKKEPYGNCKVLNQHGQLMFRCDMRRASWYMVRNLATVVATDPYTIQLNFETKGPGHIGDPYYLSEKTNRCAVCGSGEHLTRHHIIPKFYRRNFPDNLKSRNSFDVLPLCIACHSDYERHGDDFRKELSIEYGVPLSGLGKPKNRDLSRIRHCANALLTVENLHPNQREKFLVTLRAYLKKEDVTEQDLKTCAEMNADNPDYVDHGAAVMAKVTDIPAFIKRWRKHFIATMKPKFLPTGWDQDRPVKRIGD